MRRHIREKPVARGRPPRDFVYQQRLECTHAERGCTMARGPGPGEGRTRRGHRSHVHASFLGATTMLHVNSVVEMVARLGEETEESSGWSSSGGWVDDTSVTAPRDEKAWGQLGPAGPGPGLRKDAFSLGTGCKRSQHPGAHHRLSEDRDGDRVTEVSCFRDI